MTPSIQTLSSGGKIITRNTPCWQTAPKYILQILSWPATSVSNECDLSTAEDLVTAHSPCLSCDEVDQLIFLKNMDINNG